MKRTKEDLKGTFEAKKEYLRQQVNDALRQDVMGSIRACSHPSF